MQRIGSYLVLASILVTLSGTPAMAQSVRQFLTSADRIPRNATALLMPSARRLMNELGEAFSTVRSEQEALQARGQPRTICMPEKVTLNALEIESRFRSIPEARRNITVTQAVREWMAEKHPC
ncbi:hypothetical protein [Brevundimonas terrae]|uniref:hypothetical protein n=1 Tax=Brevundimonas terrae TaxID=363631 RepID=UPI0014217492|nr:hypothetical protein [Brevundimonas terrae]NIJ26436.1 hypothetical protein [Brevundimonas terrae]